jgi:hypothetical protein
MQMQILAEPRLGQAISQSWFGGVYLAVNGKPAPPDPDGSRIFIARRFTRDGSFSWLEFTAILVSLFLARSTISQGVRSYLVNLLIKSEDYPLWPPTTHRISWDFIAPLEILSWSASRTDSQHQPKPSFKWRHEDTSVWMQTWDRSVQDRENRWKRIPSLLPRNLLSAPDEYLFIWLSNNLFIWSSRFPLPSQTQPRSVSLIHHLLTWLIGLIEFIGKRVRVDWGADSWAAGGSVREAEWARWQADR